ncbi:MAG: Stp1/IreP family PP2C-type Ser/Thr phosphatase [Burkholderiaceae bacterium]|jgi:protein phosphatase|nr:Stp1/IreP family PP2C-type Ser/Thr phosphatase [Burkholderiaceae bacterium]
MLAEDFPLEFAALTDVGRKRTNNEDAVRVEPEHGFVVLADGLGGYNAGEVASRMAVEGIGAGLICWLQSASALPENESPRAASDALRALETCVDEVNHAIFEDAACVPDHAGMGTTLVVALAYQGQMLIGHIGDSRAYCLCDGMLTRLTRDHSLLQEQLDAGLMTPAQAAVSPHYNLLTRGLGVEATVSLDVQTVLLQKGNIYLLCSDGLTNMVSDADIAQLLGSGLPLPGMAQALVDQANANGGQDNVTVALIRVEK